MLNIGQLLNIENIGILDNATHKEVIEKLLSLIKNSPNILDYNILKDAIWEREKIVSTGIGLGLAIPHARRDIIQDFVASAVLIKNEVEWKSIDDKPVKFAILIASPLNTHKDYLQLLAQTVLMWKDDYKRKKISEASSPKEIFNFFKETNF
jgi:PTS system nitrogen regulatory IIA component